MVIEGALTVNAVTAPTVVTCSTTAFSTSSAGGFERRRRHRHLPRGDERSKAATASASVSVSVGVGRLGRESREIMLANATGGDAMPGRSRGSRTERERGGLRRMRDCRRGRGGGASGADALRKRPGLWGFRHRHRYRSEERASAEHVKRLNLRFPVAVACAVKKQPPPPPLPPPPPPQPPPTPQTRNPGELPAVFTAPKLGEETGRHR